MFILLSNLPFDLDKQQNRKKKTIINEFTTKFAKVVEHTEDKRGLILKNEKKVVEKVKDAFANYMPRKLIDSGTTASVNRDRKMLNAAQLDIKTSYNKIKIIKMPNLKACLLFFFGFYFYFIFFAIPSLFFCLKNNPTFCIYFFCNSVFV